MSDLQVLQVSLFICAPMHMRKKDEKYLTEYECESSTCNMISPFSAIPPSQSCACGHVPLSPFYTPNKVISHVLGLPAYSNATILAAGVTIHRVWDIITVGSVACELDFMPDMICLDAGISNLYRFGRAIQRRRTFSGPISRPMAFLGECCYTWSGGSSEMAWKRCV